MHPNVGNHMLVSVLTEFRRIETTGWNAITQVAEDDLFSVRIDDEANSLSMLIRHLDGHVRYRFADLLQRHADGPWRNARAEFDPNVCMGRQEALDLWHVTWRRVFEALRPLTWRDLERTVQFGLEPCTLFDILLRELAHYAAHVGQIVLLAKHVAGRSWVSLSPPMILMDGGAPRHRL